MKKFGIAALFLASTVVAGSTAFAFEDLSDSEMRLTAPAAMYGHAGCATCGRIAAYGGACGHCGCGYHQWVPHAEPCCGGGWKEESPAAAVFGVEMLPPGGELPDANAPPLPPQVPAPGPDVE